LKYQKLIFTPFTLLLAVISIYSSAGQIYHCKDSSGKKSFQSFPCKEVTVKVQEVKSTPNSANINEVRKNEVLSCKSQNDKELRQIMSDINAYYDKRLKGCKMSFKKGSFQIKNCKQEQEEIKQSKIKKYYNPKLKKCG